MLIAIVGYKSLETSVAFKLIFNNIRRFKLYSRKKDLLLMFLSHGEEWQVEIFLSKQLTPCYIKINKNKRFNDC